MPTEAGRARARGGSLVAARARSGDEDIHARLSAPRSFVLTLAPQGSTQNAAAMHRTQEATRRSLLRGLAVAAGAAAASALPLTAEGFFLPLPKRFVPPRTVLVYRLRTRKTKACHACRQHHRFIVCRTRALMDANRAHLGCNCPIVIEAISKHLFKRLFPRGSNGVALLPRGGGDHCPERLGRGGCRP